MRKKPNLGPRMERCEAVLIKEPVEMKGKWLERNIGYNEVYLEIGCGKGKFTAETAVTIPDKLMVAVERVPDAMVIGMERVTDAEIKNVRFIDFDASRLCDIFENGEVSRIYLNFSDPWPSRRHEKRRLTAEGFLNIYKKIMSPGAEIHFKTDNQGLFEFSVKEFERCGFVLSEVTRDLHENGPVGIMTDYEKKFYEQGMKINRCVARIRVEKE